MSMENQSAVTDAGNAPRGVRPSDRIMSGEWAFLNSTIVDLPTHYAVQQYRDQKGRVQTVRMNREGQVLSVA